MKASRPAAIATSTLLRGAWQALSGASGNEVYGLPFCVECSGLDQIDHTRLIRPRRAMMQILLKQAF